MIRRSVTGEKNDQDQLFGVRNVRFEPVEDPGFNWVAAAVGQIREAFRFRTPAIVSTHRLNYVGGLDLANRDRNLKMLDRLLAEIRGRWPDVEFISSDELLTLMTATDEL